MHENGYHSRVGDALGELVRLAVKQLRCHGIDVERRRAAGIACEDLSETWKQSGGELWIDMQASDPNEFRAFLEQLDLHPLIIEDCLEPHRSSRFSSYENSLHFEVPVFSADGDENYLSVICVPQLLITICNSPIPEVERLSQDDDQQVPLNEGTKSALLYAILDSLTDRLVRAATEARDEIRRMCLLMDTQPKRVNVDQIISAKRSVQAITSIAEDQLYIVSAMLPVDTTAFPMSQQRDYFRDATRNHERAVRILHRYEARAAELHQQYLSSLQARTESRLRILTILSAVYMPLTLIAGIYGMNFSRMPELQVPWGYPAVLWGMTGIAVAQAWFFYKRGWFG